MSCELMEHDSPVPRDADWMRKIGCIGEGELNKADAIREGIPGTLGIDVVSHPAMIDGHRKGRAIKVTRDVEPRVLNQPEKAVAMIVGIYRRKIICPRSVIKNEWVGLRR